MELLNTILTIFSMFILIIIMDYIWLGIITKDFIISEFSTLIKVENGSIKINQLVGLITWLIIALGCYIFAVYSSNNIEKTLILGALFGFISYAIYDLTNLTFIVNYPFKFVFVDIAWGTILCTSISAFGYLIRNLLEKFL